MSACSELAGRFDFGPGLLEWLPGETLFSLISRQHRLSGRRLAAETCRIFFGSARGGSQHDFPTCLDELAHRTGGLLGSAEEFATRGTLLRFYAPFKSQAIVESCVAAMRGPSLGSLKFKLGLLTSRFRAHHPLKYCRSCVEVDAATEGSAYWHVEHQYPGVWVCSQHHRPLEEAAVKANGVGRHLWFLPADVAIQRESVRANHPVQWSAAPTVSGLAKMICETVERSDAGLLGNELQLHACYRLACSERIGSAVDRRNVVDLAESFAGYVRSLPELAEFAALPRSAAAAATQIDRFVVRPPRSGTHPLRHLVLMHWLFGSYEEFAERFAEAVPAEADRATNDSRAAVPTSKEADGVTEALVALMDDSGLSVSAAARKIGVDVTTAAARLARLGRQINRRPKTLDNTVRARLVADLRRGLNKEDAAHRHKVSLSTVTSTLRTTPGLQTTWHDVRNKRDRKQARSKWSRLVARHRHEGVKAIRAMAPAVYAWLYRNDQGWLTECNQQVERSARSTAPRVEWDERDSVLATKVKVAAAELHAEQGEHGLARWQICQRVPELKPHLRHLERLPLTANAIDSAVRRRRPDSSPRLF